MLRPFRQAAFTLIEIIVTLVVVGIAAVALLSVFTSNVRGSADPVIQQQAITIAEAYMEEILLQAFEDPTDAELGLASTEGSEGSTRALFDDVQDYNHLMDKIFMGIQGLWSGLVQPNIALANFLYCSIFLLDKGLPSQGPPIVGRIVDSYNKTWLGTNQVLLQ